MLNSFRVLRAVRRASAECQVSLSRVRSWFDDAGATGGNGSTGATTPTDTQNAGTGSNEAGKGTPGDKGAGTSTTATPPGKAGGEGAATTPEIITLTPAALEERLQRERAKIIKDLGEESFDAAKTRIAKAKEAEDANKTELEKATAAAEAEKVRAAKLEADLTAERQARIIDKRNTKITQEALKAGAKEAHKVLRAAADHPKLLEACVTKEGEPDDKAIGTLIVELKKSDKELFVTTPGFNSNAGGKTSDPNAKSKEDARIALGNRIKNSF